MSESQRVWPRAWLMTDERLGERLWPTLESLPEGSGIVLRHYSLAPAERAALGTKIAEVCQSLGLTLAVAGDSGLAERLRAALVHNPRTPTELPLSRAVHNVAEAEAARAEGASLAFVSPIRPTRSHPSVVPLSRDEARAIVHACGCAAIALGGMNAHLFWEVEQDGFYGWAGIDAWVRT